MGINILSKKVLDYIPINTKFDMPDLILALKSNNKMVACYHQDYYWKDIGRFDDYQQASNDFVNDPKRFLLDSDND